MGDLEGIRMDREDDFDSRVDLVNSLLSVQEAFRDLDFDDHPAVRNWRETQDSEAIKEAKEAAEDESQDKAESNIKVNIDPQSKSVMDSIMDKFNQEAIFGEAASSEGREDPLDWDQVGTDDDLDWSDMEDDVIRDEL